MSSNPSFSEKSALNVLMNHSEAMVYTSKRLMQLEERKVPCNHRKRPAPSTWRRSGAADHAFGEEVVIAAVSVVRSEERVSEQIVARHSC